MKTRKTMILLLSLLTILSSCKKESEKMDIILQPDKNICEIDDRVFSQKEQIEVEAFDGTLEELNDLFPVRCIRLEFREGKPCLRVIYRFEQGVLMAVFDESHEHMFTYFRLWSIDRYELEEIQTGESIDSVIAKDPNGDYTFLYTGHGKPWESTHFTRDGYYVIIEYDERLMVINKTVRLL